MADKILVQIANYIIGLLKGDTDLSAVKDSNIFVGPPAVKDKYPHISVVWEGGPINRLGFKIEDWYQVFFVTVIDRRAKNVSGAETFTMNAVVDIKELIDGDHTLGGLVKEARIINLEGDVVVNMTDYGKVNERIAGGRITVRVQHLTDLP